MSGFGSRIEITGLKNVARAVTESGDELDRWLRDGLQQIGEFAADRIRARYRQKSEKGAEGVKVKVMKRGSVIVAQTLRRSRDLNRRRGLFGGYEMRHSFIPGLDEAEEETGRAAEQLFRQLEEIWQ